MVAINSATFGKWLGSGRTLMMCWLVKPANTLSFFCATLPKGFPA